MCITFTKNTDNTVVDAITSSSLTQNNMACTTSNKKHCTNISVQSIATLSPQDQSALSESSPTSDDSEWVHDGPEIWELNLWEGMQSLKALPKTSNKRTKQTRRAILTQQRESALVAKDFQDLKADYADYHRSFYQSYQRKTLPCFETNRAAHVDVPEKRVQQRDFDDGCSICLEQFDNIKSIDDIVYCSRQCGKSFHRECFIPWQASQIDNVIEEADTNKEITWGARITCSNCRAPWASGPTKSQQIIGKMLSEKYKRYNSKNGNNFSMDETTGEEQFFWDDFSTLERPACGCGGCEEEALARFAFRMDGLRMANE